MYFNFKLLGLLKSRFGYFCVLDSLLQTLIYLLKVSFVILSSQKIFLLLSRFLRRYLFQVVSVTGALKLRLI
ncbi:hypothetical protein D5E85_24650 [Vibrio parahaemolyticus]|nr:hypothetical protein D5E85_24650 [Vibrio parahaemolyticus]